MDIDARRRARWRRTGLTTHPVPHAASAPRAALRLAVVGCDHGIGTSTVAVAIVLALRAARVATAAMHPIVTGSEVAAARLRAAATSLHPSEITSPLSFEDAAAPLVAARRARRTIDVHALDAAYRQLATAADAIVVDPGGPLMTPVTESESIASLLRRWDMGAVIVAANSRGALGHVLAANAVAAQHGLDVRAVVLTTLTRERGGPAERTNQAVLKELLRTVPVLSFPFTPTPQDDAALAALAREVVAHATLTRPV